MEFVAKQSALLRELGLIQGIVEKKTTVPILANVLLSATDERVEVMATDLQVSLRSSLSAAVTGPGALSVSARKLHEIVRALPDSEVHLKSDADNWVSISCERSHFRIMGLPMQDFPTLPSPAGSGKITFGVKQFREMVQKVIFAVTTDDARFALNGALMVLSDSTLSLVSSDGHRLAHASRPLPSSAGAPREEVRVVIPHKALNELARISEEIGGEILFSRQENQLFFELGRCTLSSRLLEGQFPNFERVLPKGNDKVVPMDRVAFGDAVRRVNPELGEARDALGVDYKGGDVEIGFNAKYLLDFVAVVDTPGITLELKDEATQGLLRPQEAPAGKKGAGDKDEERADGLTYQYVIMPMRI